MAATKTRGCLSACAAAVGLAFSIGAAAQSADVQSGLDRAIRLPLEIIWLQSEIQADLWRTPALAHALQGCTKLGTPKEGCAVSVRSSWRYTFDANSAVRSAPIVVSSLNIPDAPFVAGRLNLSGSGRVYLVTSSAVSSGAIRPPAGAILLAAGSTVQLVDAAYPSIQIEVTAPQDQPLFLGNLAESDVTRVVALLVKQPGLASASAANVLESGQVALRALPPVTGVQIASISQPLSLTEPPLDLSALAGRLDMPVFDLPQRAAPPVLDQDFTLLAGALEKSEVALRALAPLANVQMAAISPSRSSTEPQLDLSALAGGMEVPVPQLQFQVASVDLSALAGRLDMPVFDLPRPATSPVPEQDFSSFAVALEQAAPLPVARVALANAPTPRASARPSAAPAADIAKMRAEVEAEIARERERIAQALQARGAPRFRFGT